MDKRFCQSEFNFVVKSSETVGGSKIRVVGQKISQNITLKSSRAYWEKIFYFWKIGRHVKNFQILSFLKRIYVKNRFWPPWAHNSVTFLHGKRKCIIECMGLVDKRMDWAPVVDPDTLVDRKTMSKSICAPSGKQMNLLLTPTGVKNQRSWTK